MIRIPHTRTLSLLFTAALLLTQCSAKIEGDTQSGQPTTQKVGPFALKVTDPGAAPQYNEFVVHSVAQESGKVDFTLAAQATDLKLRLIDASVVTAGCNASGVGLSELWQLNDEKGAPAGPPLWVQRGDEFTAPKGKSATLMVAFTSLKGCTSLSFQMVVQKVVFPTPPANWDPTPDLRLSGRWQYDGANSHQIVLYFRDGASLGWLESNAVQYTCDRTLSFRTAAFTSPSWIQLPNDDLNCTYALGSTASGTSMTLDCDSPNHGWSCDVPKGYSFVKTN